MKDDSYACIICKGFCSFYKEGKEDLCCGTYQFLKRNLTPLELRSAIELSRIFERAGACTFTVDNEIKRLVCERCDFLVDGCDFREDGSCPPCGGYILIEMLLSRD